MSDGWSVNCYDQQYQYVSNSERDSVQRQCRSLSGQSTAGFCVSVIAGNTAMRVEVGQVEQRTDMCYHSRRIGGTDDGKYFGVHSIQLGCTH